MSAIPNEKFIVTGLAGARTLAGEVRINGAKNAVLKAMAASILFDGPITIENVPDTEDVGKMIDLLITLGLGVVADMSKKTVVIDPTAKAGSAGPLSTDLDQDIAQSMRASVVTTGPLLGRFGRATFPAPGGCVIGARPVDLFIEAYKKMGAHVDIVTDHAGNARYVVTAPKSGLKGTEIIFPIQTVGGTETLMMAAVLAEGTTVLKNCAMEPEIIDLAHYLNICGAKIKGLGTTTLEIGGRGSKDLLTANRPYVTIPDRLETGSFLLLAALCAKDMTITHCNPLDLEVVIDMLRTSGVPIETTKNSIRITAPTASHTAKGSASFTSFNIRTHEYPGFPTDLQAQAVVFLTQTIGESIVFETIFEGRFKYTEEIKNMGGNITIMNAREVLIKGPTPFKALIPTDIGKHELRAHDIRAGFAVVMAALVAQGTSVINNVYYIDRGYEQLEVRLRALGADIQRTTIEE